MTAIVVIVLVRIVHRIAVVHIIVRHHPLGKIVNSVLEAENVGVTSIIAVALVNAKNVMEKDTIL